MKQIKKYFRRKWVGMKPLPEVFSCVKTQVNAIFSLTIILTLAISEILPCFAVTVWSPSVTGASLGDTFYTNDVACVFYNPALLFSLDRSQMTLSHWILFDNARHNLFGYTERFEKFSLSFCASQIYRDQIEIRKTLTDEPLYTYSNRTLGNISFATVLPYDILFGSNLKIAYYDIYDHKSHGYGLDIGSYREMFSFGSLLKNKFTFSLSCSILNLFGPTIKLVSDSERFPVVFRVGINSAVTLFPKYDIKKELLIYDKLDIIFETVTVKKTSLHFGIQYRLRNLLYLRTGYTPSGTSFGIGITAGDISFNYSIIPREYTMLHAADVIYKFGELKTVEKTPDELEDFLKTEKKAQRIFEKYYRDATDLVSNKKYDSAKTILLKIIPLKVEDKDAKQLLLLCENSIVAEKLSNLNKQYQMAVSQNNFTEAYKNILDAVDTSPAELVSKQMLEDFQTYYSSYTVLLKQIEEIKNAFIQKVNENISRLNSIKDFEAAEMELRKLELIEPNAENTFIQKRNIETQKAEYVNLLVKKGIDFAKQNSLSESYLCYKEAYRVSKDESIQFQLQEVEKQYSNKHKFELTENLYQKKLYYLAAISFTNDEYQAAREAFFELKNRNTVFDYDVLEETLIKQNIIQRTLP